MGKFKKMMEHSYLVNEMKIKVLSGHLTALDKRVVKQMIDKKSIIFPNELVFFKDVKPSSIALLPPEIWAPLKIKDFDPTLKYSLFSSSEP